MALRPSPCFTRRGASGISAASNALDMQPHALDLYHPKISDPDVGHNIVAATTTTAAGHRALSNASRAGRVSGLVTNRGACCCCSMVFDGPRQLGDEPLCQFRIDSQVGAMLRMLDSFRRGCPLTRTTASRAGVSPSAVCHCLVMERARLWRTYSVSITGSLVIGARIICQSLQNAQGDRESRSAPANRILQDFLHTTEGQQGGHQLFRPPSARRLGETALTVFDFFTAQATRGGGA